MRKKKMNKYIKIKAFEGENKILMKKAKAIGMNMSQYIRFKTGLDMYVPMVANTKRKQKAVKEEVDIIE